jgi:hypothetical protein
MHCEWERRRGLLLTGSIEGRQEAPNDARKISGHSGDDAAMSTDHIIALPVIRIDRDRKAGATIAVRISALDLSRLRATAKGWNMELSEAAAAVLSRALNPNGSKR